MSEKKEERNENVVTLGLVPAPDLAAAVAEEIKMELPGLLSYYVNSGVEWKIEIKVDSLTGATSEPGEILDETKIWKNSYTWDYGVSITDLPLFENRDLVVAEASAKHRVAFLSLPSLGAVPIKSRIEESILQLVNEMYYGSSSSARDQQQKRLQAKRIQTKQKSVVKRGARQLMKERVSEWLSPIYRKTQLENNRQTEVIFIVRSRLTGGLRLLSGMVRANRPWLIFPEFKRVVAIAFATGSYGLVFPTMWRLSGEYDLHRFILLMVTSIMAMVIWIVLAHGLWEKKSTADSPYLAKLYNATTVITLIISVLFYYLLLFSLFLLAVFIFVPASLLADELGAEAFHVANYFALAWVASSVATIVGALGAVLEREEIVRNATYGYRQRRRYEEMKKRKQEQKEEENWS